MSFHGGVIGIVAASILILKKKIIIIFFKYLDNIALVSPIGIFLEELQIL